MSSGSRRSERRGGIRNGNKLRSTLAVGALVMGNSNLSTAPTVVLPANDGEGSLAGDAGAAGVVRDPVWRVCSEK